MSQNLAVLSAPSDNSSSTALIKGSKIQDSPVNQAFLIRGRSVLLTTGSAQSSIHNYMIDLMYAIVDQNASYHLITEFYNALGKGTNKKGLKDWIINSSPLVWSEKDVCFKRTKKATWDKAKLLTADNTPYFEMVKATKSVTSTDWDSTKKIEALKKAMAKLQKELEEHNSSLVLNLIITTK